LIAWPQNREEFTWYRGFLAGRGNLKISDDAHILAWLREGRPTWVVSFDSWMGYTCQLQMASLAPYPPRKFRQAVFNYAFNVLKRKRIFAYVSSKNTKAFRLDVFLGFREVYRAPACAEDGSDIIMLEMLAEEWKSGQEQLPAAA
jgi:hypothetical protein